MNSIKDNFEQTLKRYEWDSGPQAFLPLDVPFTAPNPIVKMPYETVTYCGQGHGTSGFGLETPSFFTHVERFYNELKEAAPGYEINSWGVVLGCKPEDINAFKILAAAYHNTKVIRYSPCFYNDNRTPQD